MNWTGDFCGVAAVWRRVLGFHFQRGVARASRSEAPRMVEELERKWRRRMRVIGRRPRCRNLREIPHSADSVRNDGSWLCANSRSFGRHLGEGMGDDAGAFFDGGDFVEGEIFEAIDLAAGPGDF